MECSFPIGYAKHSCSSALRSKKLSESAMEARQVWSSLLARIRWFAVWLLKVAPCLDSFRMVSRGAASKPFSVAFGMTTSAASANALIDLFALPLSSNSQRAMKSRLAQVRFSLLLKSSVGFHIDAQTLCTVWLCALSRIEYFHPMGVLGV